MGLTLIGFGVYKAFIEEKKEEQPKQKGVVKTEYSGVYRNGDATIKIYQRKDNSISFYLDGIENSVSFEGKINNNIVEKSIFDDNYKIAFNNNSLTFETSDENATSGTYNKISDYTMRDYYNDNYGDENYINTRYNGEFKQGDIIARLYQKDENIVRVSIYKGLNFHDLEYDIKEDGNLFTDSFDSKYEIEFNDDSFTFKETSNDESKPFDGTYTKVKSLTMEEILEKFI